jgi:hypothetical protein
MGDEVLGRATLPKSLPLLNCEAKHIKQASTQPNRNKTNLIVDSAIFLAFLVAMAPRFSGMAIHEWLGIAFGAAIVTHVLLHWQWVVNMVKRFVITPLAPHRVPQAAQPAQEEA